MLFIYLIFWLVYEFYLGYDFLVFYLCYKDLILCLLFFILVKIFDVVMDLFIFLFGEFSEINMVRIVMIMKFISFLVEC